MHAEKRVPSPSSRNFVQMNSPGNSTDEPSWMRRIEMEIQGRRAEAAHRNETTSSNSSVITNGTQSASKQSEKPAVDGYVIIDIHRRRSRHNASVIGNHRFLFSPVGGWGRAGRQGRPNFGGPVRGCINAEFCN